MKSRENIISEYTSIKEEIQNKIELHNNLITFTITTTVALLAFAFSKENPFLFLVPFCILIPMSSRIAYYRLAFSKLSAYLIVFIEPELEECNWETRNYFLININITDTKTKIKNSIIMHYYDLFIISIICYVLFLFYYLQNVTFITINYIIITNVLWPLGLVIYEFMLTKRINSGDKKKAEWIEKWNELKQLENENL